MFQPTQILRNEHDVILKALKLLETCADLINDGVAVSPDALESLIEFFRLYADRTHHGKEEDLLFPALEAKGVPRDGGPIGCMLKEHEQNRMLTRSMVQAIAAMRTGSPEAALDWASAAELYSEGLRDHIYKENQILFVMAERAFTAADEPAMLAAFNKVDEEKITRKEIARLEGLIDLVASLLPQQQSA